MKVQSAIEQKLESTLAASHLEVVNESHKHRGPSDAETHFKVIVVSTQFAELGLLDRHRRVYDLLQAEMANGVHALALHLFTPDEWESKGKALNSPACLGGSKSG